MIKVLVLILVSFSTLACATGYTPRYYFNEVLAVNLTSATITEVTVNIADWPRPLSCEDVAKNAMCADRFAKRRYPNQGIELSWTHTDGSRKSDSFAPAVPITFNPAFALRIVMEINADGSVKAFYEQDEPGGVIYY